MKALYPDAKFKETFRYNSFFIGNNTREAVNKGLADYTPIFLSQVPGLFQKKLAPVDVALIQTSLPDEHGFMSFGISVDIVKAAAENATLVIAQVIGDDEALFVHAHHGRDQRRIRKRTSSPSAATVTWSPSPKSTAVLLWMK